MHSPAITSIAIQTCDLKDYREFLETVAFDYTQGIIVNFSEWDAASFREGVLND